MAISCCQYYSAWVLPVLLQVQELLTSLPTSLETLQLRSLAKFEVL